MKEMYKTYYKAGEFDAEFIRFTVKYMPAFGLTPLDYEEITGQNWPKEQATT
ncbi:hypothetical protein [Weissella viridescens]|jgi:hypothetical protein|uniref:hypothetical protein n=1 Tax=Weissella viridescens TaxID=1629 RepID=UPI0022E19A4E|nr:hypothetical protein [Weissella viridescens]